MEGLENWVYEYQKVLIDEKQGEIVGFWKQIVNKTDGTQGEIYGIGGSWFRLNSDQLIEWQRDFFDFGHVAKMFGDLIEVRRSQHRNAEANRAQRRRREATGLLPAWRGARPDLVSGGPTKHLICCTRYAGATRVPCGTRHHAARHQGPGSSDQFKGEMGSGPT